MSFDEVSFDEVSAPKVNVLNLKYELNLVMNIHDLLYQGMGGLLMAHQGIDCLVGLYGIEFV